MLYTKARQETIGKLALASVENHNAIVSLGDSMYRRGALVGAIYVAACVSSCVVGWRLREFQYFQH